jgi:hypothetical protein
LRILINDFESEHEKYKTIFQSFGYEKNELIFCTTFDQSKSFLINFLENKKQHIDLIITNDSSEESIDSLKSLEFCFLKNSLVSSYSYDNFRICSIPIILYSTISSSLYNPNLKFDSVVRKNQNGNHKYFLLECENCIKNWRRSLLDDLNVLGINRTDLQNLKKSKKYKKHHKIHILGKEETYFLTKTSIVSTSYINRPGVLMYDWLLINQNVIEKAILEFNNTYKNHLKYDSKNNERTILHDFFNKNQLILLRDAYKDLEYEKNLNEVNSKSSEECDFILKTEYPEFLNTTFFEVKKEDVRFYVKKHTKRPQFSADFFSHLKQIYGYKEFAENPINQPELKKKLGYETNKFDFLLLAGRNDEKQEMKDLFSKDINQMFNQIEVITYEELEEINVEYLDKFNRLME